MLHLPCTKTDKTPLCEVQRHLEACNDVLWHVGFHLREAEDEFGELCLVRTSQKYSRHAWLTRDKSDFRTRAAIELLKQLLVLHRCITFVELDGNVAIHDVLLRTLYRNTRVKSLLIYDFHRISLRDPDLSANILRTITSLTHIEKLVFQNRVDILKVCKLSPALWIDKYITGISVLDVADLRLSQSDAGKLVSMLIRNSTITDLAVGASVFTLVSAESSDGFVDFLVKAHKRLQKLSLKSIDFCSTAKLEKLVSTIAAITTLEKLAVNIPIYGSEGTAIFADVVARNTALRSLSVILPEWWDLSTFNDHISGDQQHRDDRIRRWACALAKNSTLTDLTLDTLGFEQEECCSFFRAVAGSTRLQHVTVQRLLDNRCASMVCRTIRDGNLAGRVTIKGHALSTSNVAELPECREVECVSLHSYSPIHANNICTAFSILGSCSHIRTLCIKLHNDCFTESIHITLSQYLRAAKNLRDLQLYISWQSYIGPYSRADGDQSYLISALSSGITLSKFTFDGPLLSEEDCLSLSKAILRSRTLHQLSLSMGPDTSTYNGRLLRCLAPRATENYSLLHVSVEANDESDEDSKILAEVTRRNSSLVTRAACFVMGNRTNYCARTVELVAEHPKLVELVQKKASVRETQAKEMTRRALTSIASLNEFMKAASVVKDRVECIAQQGTRMQIDDLNEYCWRNIRKYIKVADVQV